MNKNDKINLNKLPPSIIKQAKNLKIKEHEPTDKIIESFTNSLKITSDQISTVENYTRTQNKSEEWFQQRKGRSTASAFGRICKRINSIKKNSDEIPNNLINFLLGENKIDTYATRHGIAME